MWCDLRVGRHVFELDGRLKYTARENGGLADDPAQVLWAEKQRQDFVTGFKLGVSRITYADLFSGRAAAKARLLREYADTCRRFGTDVTRPGAVLGAPDPPHVTRRYELMAPPSAGADVSVTERYMKRFRQLCPVVCAASAGDPYRPLLSAPERLAIPLRKADPT